MLNAPYGQNEEEVNVVLDSEVEDQAVELLGNSANLGFSMKNMTYPFIVIHLKNMNKYFRFELTVSDTKVRYSSRARTPGKAQKTFDKRNKMPSSLDFTKPRNTQRESYLLN